MLTIIVKSLPTILICAALVAVVILAIRAIRKDRKQGKCSCGGSCGSCPMGGTCHASADPTPQAPADTNEDPDTQRPET